MGLGESVQKLFYLPEAHTDFVFAVLAEELGLAGVIVTLALFVVLVWRAFHIARQAAEAGLPFQAYFAAGFGVWLGVADFINIGVNLGLLPTKGLTLPLMSLRPREHRSSRSAGSACCCASITKRARGPAARCRGGSGRNEAHRPHHGGRHRRTCVPGARCCRVLRERGYEPVWLGTQRGLEAKLVPPHDIEIEWISDERAARQGLRDVARGAVQAVARDLAEPAGACGGASPNVVLGAGGFVVGPGGVAAWLTRRPLVIHEQNAVAGMTNRLLARLARRVLEAFPASFPPGARAERVGNPVRREIAALAAARASVSARAAGRCACS